MYAVSTTVEPNEWAHFVISHLVHQAGWSFLYGEADGTPLPEWPLPQDAPPAGVGEDSFAVLQPPATGLAACTDVFRIQSDGDDVQVHVFRRGDGTVLVWDVSTDDFDDFGDTDQYTVEFDSTTRGDDDASLFATQQAAMFMWGEKGLWWGYATSSVVTPDHPVPTLGQGPDPYPLVLTKLVDIDDGFPATNPDQIPAVTLTDSGAQSDAAFVATQWGAPASQVTRQEINWGTSLPVQTAVQAGVMQRDDVADPYFLRGTLPGLFLTSTKSVQTLLRTLSTGDDYLTVGGGWAFGPL